MRRPVLPSSVPVVVAINDVESSKLAAQLHARRQDQTTRRLLGRLREAVAIAQGERNITAWERFDDRVVRKVAGALVCSATDKALLGV